MRPIDKVIKMIAGAAIVALGLGLFLMTAAYLEKMGGAPEGKQGFLVRKVEEMRKFFRFKSPYTADEIREKAKAYTQ